MIPLRSNGRKRLTMPDLTTKPATQSESELEPGSGAGAGQTAEMLFFESDACDVPPLVMDAVTVFPDTLVAGGNTT